MKANYDINLHRYVYVLLIALLYAYDLSMKCYLSLSFVMILIILSILQSTNASKMSLWFIKCTLNNHISCRPWSSPSGASPAARWSATNGRPTSASSRPSTRRETPSTPSVSRGKLPIRRSVYINDFVNCWYLESITKTMSGIWKMFEYVYISLQILLQKNASWARRFDWKASKLRAAWEVIKLKTILGIFSFQNIHKYLKLLKWADIYIYSISTCYLQH